MDRASEQNAPEEGGEPARKRQQRKRRAESRGDLGEHRRHGITVAAVIFPGIRRATSLPRPLAWAEVTRPFRPKTVAYAVVFRRPEGSRPR